MRRRKNSEEIPPARLISMMDREMGARSRAAPDFAGEPFAPVEMSRSELAEVTTCLTIAAKKRRERARVARQQENRERLTMLAEKAEKLCARLDSVYNSYFGLKGEEKPSLYCDICKKETKHIPIRRGAPVCSVCAVPGDFE